MSVAKVTELSCSSEKSFEDAIAVGIEIAEKGFVLFQPATILGGSRVFARALSEQFRNDPVRHGFAQ